MSLHQRGQALLGVLLGLVLLSVPWLGSDAWAFVAPNATSDGLLGPLVRAADARLQQAHPEGTA